MGAQSLKSERDIDKLNAQMRVLSRRLVEAEQQNKTLSNEVAGLKNTVNWLYEQLKTGMTDVLRNACHRIADEELKAEVVYEELSTKEQIKKIYEENNIK